MKLHAFRLQPRQDLKRGIQDYLIEKDIVAGVILGCVGSLVQARIRAAGQAPGEIMAGPFEIISVSGTLSSNGSHLHICISDEAMRTFGGHLMEGCIVRTTAEIILAELGDFVFTREKDRDTGYDELVVKRK